VKDASQRIAQPAQVNIAQCVPLTLLLATPAIQETATLVPVPDAKILSVLCKTLLLSVLLALDLNVALAQDLNATVFQNKLTVIYVAQRLIAILVLEKDAQKWIHFAQYPMVAMFAKKTATFVITNLAHLLLLSVKPLYLDLLTVLLFLKIAPQILIWMDALNPDVNHHLA
jgi:hypothetical protein